MITIRGDGTKENTRLFVGGIDITEYVGSFTTLEIPDNVLPYVSIELCGNLERINDNLAKIVPTKEDE